MTAAQAVLLVILHATLMRMPAPAGPLWAYAALAVLLVVALCARRWA